MRPPKSEDQVWALAYSIATALLTLGASAKHGLTDSPDHFATAIDRRAVAIADQALQRLKEKKIV